MPFFLFWDFGKMVRASLVKIFLLQKSTWKEKLDEEGVG
jgi:hypothetical protein